MEPTHDHGASTQHVTLSQRLLQAAILAVAAMAAIEELSYARRRMRRAAGNWWAGVEHRQRSQLEGAELAFLVKRLARR